VGALASIVLGAGVVLVWTFILPGVEGFATWNPFLQEVTYPAVLVSLGALVLGSLATKRPSPERWAPFFRDGGD